MQCEARHQRRNLRDSLKLTRPLCRADKEDQDASLEGQEGHRIMKQVDDMLKLVPKVAGDILIDGSNSAPTHTSAEAGPPEIEGSLDSPPAYEPPATEPSTLSPSGPSTSSPPAAQGSSFWDLTSIKQSFSALTAGLRSKPDPLVSALCEASRRGDVSQMAGLLKHGANIDGKNEDRETPLHCAIMANQVQAVRLLLASGVDLKTWSKMPAMFLAASVGHISIARMLLQRGGPGADVKAKNVSGQQYFVDVVGSGNIDGVRFLLEHGADARVKSISGRPVVVQAARKGSLGMVKLLFDFGADVNSADVAGASLVSLALEKSDMDLMELLLTRGAKPNSRRGDGERVLATAISKGKIPFAKRLMQAGADGNVDDITGQKAIISVVKGSKIENKEKVELVRMLLQNGAKATSKDIFWPHMRALPLAVDNGVDGEVIAMLLRHGADSTNTLHNGETPLTEAINKGRVDQIEALLANGADPNLANKNDKTPLILALVKQDLGLVRLLRQHGAELDSPGQSAREFAMTLGQPDILQVLGLGPAPGSDRDW